MSAYAENMTGKITKSDRKSIAKKINRMPFIKLKIESLIFLEFLLMSLLLMRIPWCKACKQYQKMLRRCVVVHTIGRTTRESKVETAYSLELMYHRHHKSVYNYIAFRINNHHDAEELASDVFVKAIQKYDSYNPSKPMEAWLIAIAKNTVTDYLRKSMRRNFAPVDAIMGMISGEQQPDEVVVMNEKNHELMVGLSRLKDKERQILSMKFATELKHGEIGEVLGISASQVGVIVHRAMGKLRKYLEEVQRDER